MSSTAAKPNLILVFVTIAAVAWSLSGECSTPWTDRSIVQVRNTTTTTTTPSPLEFVNQTTTINETPYEQCMRQLEPDFDPSTDIYLHSAKVKSPTLSLRQAMEANQTTIYFLHQRKAGGSTIRELLFEKAVETFGRAEAVTKVFIPCHAPKDCVNFEMHLYEEHYLGSIKVVGSHMSYHVPFARSAYEDQVLITNFREPISRIKSCMLYRYFEHVNRVFGHPNYTHTDGEKLFLTQKDQYSSTCVQEPLRILSPLDPDKEPLSRHDRHKICCMVRNYFHVIQTPPPSFLNETTSSASTLIERQIMEWMANHKINALSRDLSPRVNENLSIFLQNIRSHPMVQAEIDLYDCVIENRRQG